jgi:hypothetical protein
MWVHAPAGYGKTAVAGTVTEKLRERAEELGFNPIGATFYFWRDSPERNSPARFIITLAYQLAQSIPELGPRVESVVKSKPDIVKMGLELQVVKLIVEPFKSLGDLDAMPNRLVVVDGIDECINSDRESRVEKKYAEDQETAQIRVLDLIRSLQSHQLPLSFLVLSRPEAWIKQHLESSAFGEVMEPLDLYRIGDHMNDVAKFVRAELSRIATSFGLENADKEWPDEKWLVSRSEGQMVYASTAIRHIDDPYGDPRQLLKDIVRINSATDSDISHSTPFSSLYELYGQIMRSCPKRNRALMMEVLEYILIYPYFENYEPYEAALEVLDRLSGRSPGCALKALRPLHAVLELSGKGTLSINYLLVHSSFEEFLRSPHLSPDFSLDVSRRAEFLLSKMLDCMASTTKDTIGTESDDVAVFSLRNWCRFWESGKTTFLKSETTILCMMEKVIALDLTACLIQTYWIIGIEWNDLALSEMFNDRRKPSKFFVEAMDLGGCADTRSIVDKVTSHMQSSLDSAFTFLLQPTTPLPFLPDAIEPMAGDCRDYLREVTTQPDWRKHKVVQALCSPGPDGLDLFEQVIRNLDYDSVHQQWAWDLLDYTVNVMGRRWNPILEAEDHPFRNFQLRRRRRKVKAAREAAQKNSSST